MNNKIEKRAMTPGEVEVAYGIPKGSLANMRWCKIGPRYFKAGPRRVLYMVSDVEEWLHRCPIQTIDSVGVNNDHSSN